jgi:hypothetical protein
MKYEYREDIGIPGRSQVGPLGFILLGTIILAMAIHMGGLIT